MKDTLLLDTMVSGIGVLATREGDTYVVGPGDGRVDGSEVLVLVDRDTTMPTKRSEVVRARPDATGSVAVHVVELPTGGVTDDARPVGVVEVDAHDERELEPHR